MTNDEGSPNAQMTNGALIGRAGARPFFRLTSAPQRGQKTSLSHARPSPPSFVRRGCLSRLRQLFETRRFESCAGGDPAIEYAAQPNRCDSSTAPSQPGDFVRAGRAESAGVVPRTRESALVFG